MALSASSLERSYMPCAGNREENTSNHPKSRLPDQAAVHRLYSSEQEAFTLLRFAEKSGSESDKTQLVTFTIQKRNEYVLNVSDCVKTPAKSGIMEPSCFTLFPDVVRRHRQISVSQCSLSDGELADTRRRRIYDPGDVAYLQTLSSGLRR